MRPLKLCNNFNIHCSIALIDTGDDIAVVPIIHQTKRFKPLVLPVEKPSFLGSVHPQSLTWKMMISKRNLLFQGLIFRWTMLDFRGVSRVVSPPTFETVSSCHRRPKLWPVQRKKLWRKATTCRTRWRRWKRGHLRRQQGKWSLGKTYDLWILVVYSIPLWNSLKTKSPSKASQQLKLENW